MVDQKWHWLQIFADGGASGSDGGDGAAQATGDTADDAGQQLRALGVPEDKIRRNRSYGKTGAVRSAQAEPQQDDAAAAEDKPAEAQPQKASWDELMKDPDYNREMQKVVKASKAKAQEAERNLSAMLPALKKLAGDYGMDAENLDFEALNKAMMGGYDEKAAELGVSTDVAIKLDQQQKSIERQRFAEHMQNLERQAAELQKIFPGFDLQTEMQDQRFLRLVAPGMPFSVEDAYHAVHRKEIEAAKAQAIRQTTQQQIANSIAAGQRRPSEAGTTGTGASVTHFDYSKASREEREALKARIRRGEKIYPG